jgi:hypothetical protein
MEPQRFDRLATVVGSGKSRRAVLRRLLGSALLAGGLVRWAPGEEVVAREGVLDGRLGGRHGPNRRGRDRHRAHGDKQDHQTKQDRKKKKDRDGARLGSGTPCKSPQTRCGQGKNQTCVDTQTDPTNCGACGTVCGTRDVCENGVCARTCGNCDACCQSLYEGVKADCRACGGHLSEFDCRTQLPGFCGALSQCSGCDECDDPESACCQRCGSPRQVVSGG